MIREGSPNVTLAYLSQNRNALAISNFTDGTSPPRRSASYIMLLLTAGSRYSGQEYSSLRQLSL